MIYVYIENSKFKKQIEYVFHNIFYILGLSYECINEIEEFKEYKAQDILFLYSNKIVKNNFQNTIYIQESNILFGEDYLKEASMPKNIKRYTLNKTIRNIENVISIYNSNRDLYINKDFNEKKIIETNIDFISDVFFMLTRYEEVVNREATEREVHNRFSAKESIAFKNEFLDRPIVNEWVEIVWAWIDELNLGYMRKKWWGDKDFAACLTHDVDMIQKYNFLKKIIRPVLSLLIKQREIKKAFKIIADYVKSKQDYKKDSYWTFDYIIDTEKKYGFTSSFYFMNGGTSQYDNFYKISDIKVQNLIKQIEASGFEAGYHASFNSYDNFKLMKQEKEKLDKILNNYGCRQHYLRFKVPFTWRHQEQLELLYDTTLSYADCEGFRCGTCFPFRPYDLLEDKVLKIWEIPLIVMEGTLQDPNYRNLSPEEGLNKIIQLINTVKTYNGVFTFLWHNSSFTEDLSEWRYVYEKTMEYLYESKCLGDNGRKIITRCKL